MEAAQFHCRKCQVSHCVRQKYDGCHRVEVVGSYPQILSQARDSTGGGTMTVPPGGPESETETSGVDCIDGGMPTLIDKIKTLNQQKGSRNA